MAVSIIVIIMVMVPISEGIMFQRVSRLGLYQARVVTVIPVLAAWPFSARQRWVKSVTMALT
jgi:hypothetical protein